MKKKLVTLITIMLLLMTCVVMPAYADDTVDPLLIVDFMQDFEEINPGFYTADGFKTATGMPLKFTLAQNAPSDSICAEVIEEEGGNKATRLKSSVGGNQHDTIFVLDTPITEGRIEVGYKFKATQTATPWHLLKFFSSNGNGFTTIKWTSGWGLSTTNGTIVGTASLNSSTNKYHLRAVVERYSTTADWDLKIYDDSNPDAPSVFYEAILSASSYPNISSVNAIRSYNDSTEAEAVFDDFFVRARRIPGVIEDIGCAGAEPDAPLLRIGFNGPIPNPEGKVTIVKPGIDDDDDPTNDSVYIDTTSSYNAENYKLTIVPKSYLEYNTEYEVKLESGGVKPYSFRTAVAPFYIESESITFEQNSVNSNTMPQSGVFSAKASIKLTNNFSIPKNVEVTLVAYNDMNMVVKIETINASINAESSDFPVLVELTGLNASKVSMVKAFCGETLDNEGFAIIPQS